MCEIYDSSWQTVLGLLLVFSIASLLLRSRYSDPRAVEPALRYPQWLAALMFWGSGVVGLSMLGLMILGFACAGSPGDIKGIIPN